MHNAPSSKTLLAAALATSLALTACTFSATPAHAGTVTKAESLSCRTNGAPRGYDVTRSMKTSVTLTAPAQVAPGEEAVVRVAYSPEPIPGKEGIATMKSLRKIALRFTLDDPQAFVTARLVGNGRNLTGEPKITLVGNRTLVISDLNVDVDGRDTTWAPPAFEIVLKAPQNARAVSTIHSAVEGAAGQFNNPANAITMRTVTQSAVGELDLQLNCQALSRPQTWLSIPVAGGAGSSPAQDARKSQNVHKSQGARKTMSEQEIRNATKGEGFGPALGEADRNGAGSSTAESTSSSASHSESTAASKLAEKGTATGQFGENDAADDSTSADRSSQNSAGKVAAWVAIGLAISAAVYALFRGVKRKKS